LKISTLNYGTLLRLNNGRFSGHTIGGFKMNIYLISQTENCDYDTYDSFICFALDEQDARQMHPSGDNEAWLDSFDSSSWCSTPDQANVVFIGNNPAIEEPSIILCSYNAG
jgi:hypothetical protein